MEWPWMRDLIWLALQGVCIRCSAKMSSGLFQACYPKSNKYIEETLYKQIAFPIWNKLFSLKFDWLFLRQWFSYICLKYYNTLFSVYWLHVLHLNVKVFIGLFWDKLNISFMDCGLLLFKVLNFLLLVCENVSLP